ncbi:N-acetylmuramoyl-L-alanine amidase [Streptomyces vinaceus]|uniref:N-acetylmuramoyl-L-alanine amidase n=1 Tax=Streptomyces vinaceus TaxID=1960 RepID=UPI0035DC5703
MALNGVNETAAEALGDGQRPAILTQELQTHSFQVLGVTWKSGEQLPSGAHISVRTRHDGKWTGWQNVRPTTTTASEDDSKQSGRTGTDAFLAGQSDGVQVRVEKAADAKLPNDMELTLVDGGTAPGDASAGAQKAGKQATSGEQPEIAPHIAWCTNDPNFMPDPKDPQKMLSCQQVVDAEYKVEGVPAKAAILNHALQGSNANDYTEAQVPGIIRAMFAYLKESQDFGDGAYNFVVDRFGRIWENRKGSIAAPNADAESIRGAHTAGWNVGTIGVGLLGDFSGTNQPSDSMMQGVAHLLAWKFSQYKINPEGKVALNGKEINTLIGASDVIATDSPGNASKKLPALRKEVADLMGQAQHAS